MDEARIKDLLRSFHDVSKAINSTLNPSEVEDVILDRTARLMHASKVLILLLDESKKVLTLHRSHGLDQKEQQVKSFHNIKPFGHCLVRKGTFITIDEVLSDKDLRLQRQHTPFICEMVFAPLEIKSEACGLLGVSSDANEFSSFDLEIFCSLGAQAAIALENANLYQKLHDTFIHTTEALAEVINSRDPYTGGHTMRVSQYALQLGEKLGLSTKEKEDLRLAAILHDIGKIGIDDAILRKRGALSQAEKNIMKKHPEIGAAILEHIDDMSGVIPGVRHHHEWYNGSGYPAGQARKDIPLIARIIAIADVFDALTTDRPYRRALGRRDAVKCMTVAADSHFDPVLLDLFSKRLSLN
jgi:putative nucleotidyltransferase with HDIG domain